ncbi:hypothetical protein COB55_05225 [Candidatus Wolfebacteria bacterium]|nr:MAG: hypothetical protein COB55_05225 [Candidatus Wolfebacteria bacterium]
MILRNKKALAYFVTVLATFVHLFFLTASMMSRGVEGPGGSGFFLTFFLVFFLLNIYANKKIKQAQTSKIILLFVLLSLVTVAIPITVVTVVIGWS